MISRPSSACRRPVASTRPRGEPDSSFCTISGVACRPRCIVSTSSSRWAGITLRRCSEIARSMISATARNDAMIRNQTGQPAAWMIENTDTSGGTVARAPATRREPRIVGRTGRTGQVGARPGPVADRRAVNRESRVSILETIPRACGQVCASTCAVAPEPAPFRGCQALPKKRSRKMFILFNGLRRNPVRSEGLGRRMTEMRRVWIGSARKGA